MHAWESIQTAVDYIEENLTEEIGIERLAAVVGLSPFYFQRLFARLVRRPVREYVKLRRLARAAAELGSDTRVVDIAMKYGFSSHANFTRAFKEAYGITPEECKKKGLTLNSFIKPEIVMNYAMADEDVPLIVGDIVLEVSRKVLESDETYIGFEAEVATASQIPAGESTGIDVPGELWKQFHAAKDRISGNLDPAIEMGMSYDARDGAFTYFAGGLLRAEGEALGLEAAGCQEVDLETADSEVAGSRFIEKKLEAGEYLVCSVEAESFITLVTSALDQAGRYLFGKWLPSHHLATRPFSAEKYNMGLEGVYRLEIWVSPVELER